MNLEIEMYRVMAALSSGDVPVDFKGAMVLHAFLYENGFSETAVRPTRDIDANWLSDTPPSMNEIVSAFQQVLDQKHIPLTVKYYRAYGDGKSAGLDFCSQDTGNTIFTMDMDINRPEAGIRYYNVESFRFRGVVVEQILADKISAISTDKVFRRLKDVIDLYYLSQCFTIDPEKVMAVMSQTGRRAAGFDGFLNHVDELEHAYEKFRFAGGSEKPMFSNVYGKVKAYISDFLPHE